MPIPTCRRWLLLLLLGPIALAADPLAPLAGNDPKAWSAAINALYQEVAWPEAGPRLQAWADDPREVIATLVWSLLGNARPDAAVVRRALGRRELRPLAARALPTLQLPELRAGMLEMAQDRDPVVAALAISGLIHLGPDPATRLRIRSLLAAPAPEVRARAAEWLRWHGVVEDLPTLRSRREVDLQVLADVTAATAAIAGRPTTVELPLPAPPLLHYGDPAPDGAQAEAEAQGERLRQALVPLHPAAAQKGRIVDPVIGFPAERPGSFGRVVPGAGPMSGLVHAGHDCAWNQPDAPVVAIADGVVRLAKPAVPSFGGLVVVEHDGPAGPYCSLYGHLGLLLAVREGDRVAGGDLLGAVGRNHSSENGGYVAHLHFGVHAGAFGDHGWITGYVREAKPEQFGWLDPLTTMARLRQKRPAVP